MRLSECQRTKLVTHCQQERVDQHDVFKQKSRCVMHHHCKQPQLHKIDGAPFRTRRGQTAHLNKAKNAFSSESSQMQLHLNGQLRTTAVHKSLTSTPSP